MKNSPKQSTRLTPKLVELAEGTEESGLAAIACKVMVNCSVANYHE